MARRITIVSGKNLTDDDYADHRNGIWAVLKIAHLAGRFHPGSDGVTTVPYLNDRWAERGRRYPWQ